MITMHMLMNILLFSGSSESVHSRHHILQ